MKLSILIPSIPSRFKLLTKIFAKLDSQSTDEVEILVFIDNKRRSIGLKRDALMQMSKGDYVCFVDDDDDVEDDYIEQLLIGCAAGKDVVVFWQRAYSDGKEAMIDFDLSNENTPFIAGAIVARKPFHVCAFRGDIARQYRFPNLMYGEDWIWCEKVLDDVKTQYKIGKILHTYNYDSKITEAL